MIPYQRLVADAMSCPFEGWDWGVFDGRFGQADPPWDYHSLVRGHGHAASSMLDLGTGGGEFLSGLAPLPARTVATEGYSPNVAVARRTLAPLGVEVTDTSGYGEGELPFPDGGFDLVTSRHEFYLPAEVHRVLRPGGVFLTQQVGGRDVEQLNQALGAPPHDYRDWGLAAAAAELEHAGFELGGCAEEELAGAFCDIGAVVLFLRITPWQIPDFTPERYDRPLRALHVGMSAGRPLEVTCHRFLLTAHRRP